MLANKTASCKKLRQIQHEKGEVMSHVSFENYWGNSRFSLKTAASYIHWALMSFLQVSDVMREKPGSVTKLMYQLFIALNRKEQQNLTSHAMEAMKSSQKMTLETANAEFYQNVSRHLVKVLKRCDLYTRPSENLLIIICSHHFNQRRSTIEILITNVCHFVAATTAVSTTSSSGYGGTGQELWQETAGQSWKSSESRVSREIFSVQRNHTDL